MLNMFRAVFHSSSAAHNMVSAVSGINETVIATCRERGWVGYQPRSQQVAVTASLMPDTADTVLWAADDGWNTARNIWEVGGYK